MISKGSTYYVIFLDIDEKEVCAEITAVSDDSDLWDDVYATSPTLYDYLVPENFVCITEDRPALELIDDLSELM